MPSSPIWSRSRCKPGRTVRRRGPATPEAPRARRDTLDVRGTLGPHEPVARFCDLVRREVFDLAGDEGRHEAGPQIADIGIGHNGDAAEILQMAD